MQKADHTGHRQRLKQKYLQSGVEVLQPHEVLEMLLYYAVPQRNTNDIAKNLLDHFGSLSAVLDAGADALVSAGLTPHQALLLQLIPDVIRLYMLDKHANPDKILTFDALPAYMVDKFIGYEQDENILLVLIDKKGKELYSGMIAKGDFHSANISIRNIVSLAVKYRATGAFLAHNHPSGVAIPSVDDITATHAVADALSLVNVRLLDHFIVADHDCVSMAQSGQI